MNDENGLTGGTERDRARFIKSVICGIAIGLGGILPGVSGGVLAVSFGLYKPMIDALVGFFKSPKRNFLFLLPVGIGGFIGVMLGAVVLNSTIDTLYKEIMYLFLGLVAGGVPSLLHEANRGGFRPKYLIATVIGAAIASTLLLLERDAQEVNDVVSLTAWQAMLSGAIIAMGVVLPGLVTSFILMYLGWYKATMDAIATINIGTLFFIGIGGAVFALATLKAASWFYDKHHGYAYYGSLGFLIVSAILIFPGFELSFRQLINILLAAVGFAIALFSNRLGQT